MQFRYCRKNKSLTWIFSKVWSDIWSWNGIFYLVITQTHFTSTSNSSKRTFTSEVVKHGMTCALQNNNYIAFILKPSKKTKSKITLSHSTLFSIKASTLSLKYFCDQRIDFLNDHTLSLIHNFNLPLALNYPAFYSLWILATFLSTKR